MTFKEGSSDQRKEGKKAIRQERKCENGEERDKMRETVKVTVSNGESEGTKNNCGGEKHTDSNRDCERYKQSAQVSRKEIVEER